MSFDQFTLSWKQFERSASNAIKDLYNDQDFTDVTLATRDGEHITAHRNIISSISPVFKKILLTSNQLQPIIYLRGVTEQSLRSLIRFIYLGQVEVYQEHLDDFMETARELQIEGLCNNDTETSDDNGHSLEDKLETEDTKVDKNEASIHQLTDETSDIKQFNTDISFTNDFDLENGHGQTELLDLFSCTKCEFTSKHRSNLLSHIRYKHEGVRYGCKECSYQATTTSHLKRHVMKGHRL